MEKKENYKKITIGESSEFLARLRENVPEEIIQGIFDVRINLDYVSPRIWEFGMYLLFCNRCRWC